ncbi:MAG TPA: hypothetical protein VN700_12450 [Vicinamibacterales bacterium]|nr:hypothetical protein [Vicinamibacterales bacterium]
MPDQAERWTIKRQIPLTTGLLLFVATSVGVVYLSLTLHPGEESLAYATWALAFFTLVLAVGIPITIWIASKEREESSKRFLAQEQDRFYATLDSIYLDIQKMIIQHPHLAHPERKRSPDQETQYRAFAFIVWNFIESIYDYTQGADSSDPKRKQLTLLRETWHCIIQHEGALHAEWFAKPENHHKFKERFRKDMQRDLAKWMPPQRHPAEPSPAGHSVGSGVPLAE